MNTHPQPADAGPAGGEPADDDAAAFAEFVALFAADLDDPVLGEDARDFLSLPVEEQRAYFDFTNALANARPDVPRSALVISLLIVAALATGMVLVAVAVLR
ncbi:hypothetical protein AB0M46_41100 [Dactylosporangium sp. NPDC051485]|uniref:hypothetical protein n=1 Tax=Dactylosporangium sp. NPDC051485 TaxID=3154846 RepID=UPI0034168795